MLKRVHLNIQRYTHKKQVLQVFRPTIHSYSQLTSRKCGQEAMPSGSLQDRVSRKNPCFELCPLVWPEMWEWCQMEAFRTEDSLFWGQNINTIKNLVFDKPCIFIKVRMGNCYPKRSSHFLHLALILWTSCCHIVFVTSQLVRCLYKTMTCYHGYQQYLFFFCSIFYILSSKRFYYVLDINLLSWLWFVNLYGCNGFYEKKNEALEPTGS